MPYFICCFSNYIKQIINVVVLFIDGPGKGVDLVLLTKQLERIKRLLSHGYKTSVFKYEQRV